jgi:hypothetical protein
MRVGKKKKQPIFTEPEPTSIPGALHSTPKIETHRKEKRNRATTDDRGIVEHGDVLE